MPRKYKKRPYRKRTYKRKKKRTISPSYPLSNKFLFKTRYVELNQSLDVGTGGIPVTQVYSLTSLFDPNYTGVGHQPLGFDNIMPMYDHYTVIGARVKVTASNLDRDPQYIVLQIKDGISLSTNLSAMIENGRTNFKTLGGNETASSTQTLTANFSAKQFFSRNPMASDKQQGTVSSSPLENAFLHITVAPTTIGENTTKVVYSIIIEYIAMLTEPKQLGQS